MREGRHEAMPRDGRPDSRGGRHGGRGAWEHRGHDRENRRGMREGSEKHFKGAQTFRRGRAVAFLERLQVRRDTLQQQLEQPEFDSIKQVISGELKAVDAIIQEFIHMFELHEVPVEEDQPHEGKDESHE